MEILHLIAGHPFDAVGWLVLMASLLFTAIELRHLEKSQQVANLIAVNRERREIMAEINRQPALSRIWDSKADPKGNPPTLQETFFVNDLILNLNASFQAASVRMMVLPAGVTRDIRSFLTLPIPRSVWEHSREFQDPDFVRFVENSLDSKSEKEK